MGLNQNQRKALRRKQAAELRVAELSNTVASDVNNASTDQHPQCELSVLQLEPETAFGPESLYPENVKKFTAAGKGELVEKIQHKWDEIKAVKERYPISRGMLERIAHETMQTILLTSTATRDKLIATKLLLVMAAGNHANKGLPAQLEVNVNNNTFDMRRIIDAVLNDDAMGIHDTREMKIIPGSDQDYAE